jgi:exodeoxyribonuclease VII small subunit
MKKSEKSYEKALSELQEIIDKIQNDQYSLTELSNALTKAKELISFCENELRNIQDKIVEIQNINQL